MLRVAIVGCGKIADAHASQIQRISGCTIVGVCDREELMARQLAQRFGIGRSFVDLSALLKEARPDVVHITTPPQSHFTLARRCLEQGCHVYVEKPFTLRTAEAEGLIALAGERRLKLTAGHDDQFSHVARRMRQLVRNKYLGGAPVHLESVYCYELSDGYARALLGDREHWVRKLPGGLLQNIISHGIARIAEFIPDESPAVLAHAFTSPQLKALGEDQIVDELRVIVSGEEGITAYFTFSSQMRPCLHQLRLYGRENALMLDEDQQTLIQIPGGRLKSYAERFISPARVGLQYWQDSLRNVRTFLARDFHMKSGMKYLAESFYRSVLEDAPLPIPYQEIIRTCRIMDSIFGQISPKSLPVHTAAVHCDLPVAPGGRF
jgi:predicted dehydrogenase